VVLLYSVMAAAVVVCGFAGIAALRGDPLRGVAAEDLIIVTQRGRQQIAGPGLRDRLGGPVGRTLRAAAGDRADRLATDLIARSGRSQVMTVQDFYTQQGFFLVVLWPLAAVLMLRGLSPLLALGLVLLPIAGPWYHAWASAVERQNKIDQDLPDFLDVLSVVVSAGLGFQQALERVSARFGGPLAEELRVALQQISVGESLRASLRALQARTNSQSVDQFVTALMQAEELGAPLVYALNQIAQDVRREAAQAAKRKAAAASPKATIVTIAVLLPPTMAIMIYGVITAIRG
jgi:tight adherence protein C